MGRLVPRRETNAQPDIIVTGNSYTIVSTGQTITKNQYNQPLNGDALAQAIRFHGFPGVVLHVSGNQHKGMLLNGTNPNQTHTVTWQGQDVDDVTIIGIEPNRAMKIGGVTVFNKMGDFKIQNATLMNSGGAFAPLLVNMNGIAGFIRLYDINFLPKDPTAWQGKGMKWNIRGHGVARWDCRNLNFHEAVEHGAYIDNHQGKSWFINCRGSGMGRTMLQLTNRKQSGPSAFGDLIIKNCVAMNNYGQGGSDYTIVGNGPGTVWFINNKSFGAASGSHGAFVHWTDFGHGAYLTEGGHSTGRLIILNFEVDHPNADRDHVAITGCDEAIMANWDISGNKTALRLQGQFGGGNNMDLDKFGLYSWNQYTPSQNPGWKSWKKVKDDSTGQWLSDPEIDDLEYIRGGGRRR
ncbi:MAG: hypothetical protein K5880_13880 [Hydrogenophaga sp.]|uniref:hypothetical protein n=1 Tax=Hydrogenophaga sp. TaxID=1904254 RepID=UPI00261D0092|nr:hypothetical protein [Hydrogenophaga sp.]MCV0439711.1 hypothetical protein [Hydrogenophaga sp.]